MILVSFFYSCQNDNNFFNESNASIIEKRVLSSEEIELKNNLETTAIILRDMIIEDMNLVNYFDNIIPKEGINEDMVSFKKLLFDDNSQKCEMMRSKFNSHNLANRLKTNQDSELDDYIVVNGITLYCPYPLEDYEPDNRIPTIVAHPVDNLHENIGYEIQSDGSYKEVLVNETYTIDRPVFIVDYRQVDDNPGGGGSDGETDPDGTKKIYEVSIGEIYCTNFCRSLFEGKREMRILRSSVSTVLNGETWQATGTFKAAIPFQLPRKYIRWARNGENRGWYPVNTVWYTDWVEDQTQVIIAVYEEDPKGDYELSGTAKFTTKIAMKIKTDDGKEVSVEKGSELSVTAKGTFKCKNDFLGLNEWTRDWFMYTQTTPGIEDEYRNGLPVRRTSPDFKFTTKLRVLEF